MGLSVILFVTIAAALCVALSLWIYRSVASPINRIMTKCRSTPQTGEPLGDESLDELGFLSRAIDQYTADLEAMTQMRVVDQRRKRELELEALQYQVNPHFLFNTLGTLKWVAIINDAPPVISKGITSLSELLRSVLLSKDEMIPIREELENLAHYFMIQRIRYAECFEVVNEIDLTAEENKIPRFILQPLAENAILHGSEGGTRQIVITVRCARTPEGVLLEILDNGNGFDPSAVRNNHDEKFSGIGLSNVDERLKLYFGDRHGLDIRSRPGEGTVCRLLIPDRPDMEGDADDVPGIVC
jgi:two-component system sensor histidine kinase YesM